MQYDADETDIPLSSLSIRGLPLCNLRFADDIGLLRSCEVELQQLTERLEKWAAGYGMEIRPTKAKFLWTTWSQDHLTNGWMGKTLEEVDQLDYLGSTQTKAGTSIKEEEIRLPQAYSAMTRLGSVIEKQTHQFSRKD